MYSLHVYKKKVNVQGVHGFDSKRIFFALRFDSNIIHRSSKSYKIFIEAALLIKLENYIRMIFFVALKVMNRKVR